MQKKLVRRLFATQRTVLNGMKARNLLFQCNHNVELENHVAVPRVVYAGFDPTAKSLHVGNLLVVMALLHFQIHGHHPIALIGGATGSIGDPSGKSSERPIIDSDTINQNSNSIRMQLENLFDNATAYANRRGFTTKHSIQFVNNLEWFKDISFLEFMSSVGRHFRVNSMVAKDSVKSRLADMNGISLSEFMYQVLQSYDYLMLFQKLRCTIQVDQAHLAWRIRSMGQHHFWPGADSKKYLFE
jgi:tyrosyl-tRNA synthetase